MRRCVAVLMLLAGLSGPAGAAAGGEGGEGGETVAVAGKNFAEGYILGEIVAQLLEREGFAVERRLGLGGTKICYDALAAGAVDVYIEYTGTIAEAILDLGADAGAADMSRALAADGIEMLPPLGFDNTYAIAVSAAFAAERGIATLSDLAAHGDARLALSHEFLERRDGWPGLAEAYGFAQAPQAIEHALAYQAIADGAIDGTDAYSTDGELDRHALAVLGDDRGFFPDYLAVPLVRADLDARAKAAIARLAGTLDDAGMRALNAAALAGESTADVARRHVVRMTGGGAATAPAGESLSPANDGLWARLAANTARHLQLVALALAPAALLAVLLAIAIFKVAWLSRAAVYGAGLLQTIPSIALLALLIPLAGIGTLPAVAALFLYALLPILRNALTALAGIDPTLRRVAVAMGLSPWQEVRFVFVPLAMPGILAGIRIAAVIGIGTATLAAFIGAGGLGDPIVKGLALNDTRLILEGALPAAALAVAAELVFEAAERWLLPGHLRTGARAS